MVMTAPEQADTTFSKEEDPIVVIKTLGTGLSI